MKTHMVKCWGCMGVKPERGVCSTCDERRDVDAERAQKQVDAVRRPDGFDGVRAWKRRLAGARSGHGATSGPPPSSVTSDHPSADRLDAMSMSQPYETWSDGTPIDYGATVDVREFIRRVLSECPWWTLSSVSRRDNGETTVVFRPTQFSKMPTFYSVDLEQGPTTAKLIDTIREMQKIA